MKNAIAKAEVLIEALPYIQSFRGEVVVVKLGGSAMEDKRQFQAILTDVTFMECVGMRPAISRAMTTAGLTPRFVRGLRVTDDATISVVANVLRCQINPEIVASLKRLGATAQSVAGEAVFRVEQRTERDEATGETLDWGWVGEIRSVDPEPVAACLDQRTVPVVTPLGTGPDGRLFNLNAEDAAAALAGSLKARKLVFVSDVPGLLRDRNDESTLLSTLRISEVEELVRTGVVNSGMLPKVRSCAEALAAGVRKIHIIDARVAHSLLLEIFTDKGIGTEIIA